MECNVGGLDRALRAAALAGTVAVALSAKAPGKVRFLASLLAAVETFTVLSRYCPLNQAFGVNTCRRSGTYLEERRPEHYAG